MRARLLLLVVAACVSCGDKDGEADASLSSIDWWFPRSGFESVTTLLVKASESVTLDGNAGVLDERGVWLFADVGAGDHVLADVDTQQTIHLTSSPMFGGLLTRLTRGLSGSVVGFDALRLMLVRYSDTDDVHYAALAPDVAGVIGMNMVGNKVVAAMPSEDGIAIVSIDALSGARTLLQTCDVTPSSASSFVTPNGEDFYIAIPSQGIVLCTPQDREPTTFAYLAEVSVLLADPDHNRLLAPAGASVVAVAIPSGAVTHVYDGSSAIRGVVAFGPEIYFMTSEGVLNHVTGATTADVLATVPGSFCNEVVGCGVGELCVQCDALYIAASSNGTWSVKPAPSGNVIGTDVRSDGVRPQWWTDIGFGEALFDVNGAVPLTPALEDGTMAVRQGSTLALVDLNDPTTTISIGGDPITTSLVALPSAATVVYVNGRDIHSRDVASGSDSVLAISAADVVSVAADKDGAIYVVTASSVSAVSDGGLTPKLSLGGTATNHTIDPRTATFIVSSGGTFTSYDLVSGQASAPVTCDIPVELTSMAPGPLTGTVIGIAEHMQNALVLADLTTATAYVLAHGD